MLRMTFIIGFIIFHFCLWAEQLNMNLFYQSDQFRLYAEDKCDYSSIILLLEKKNKEFQILFNEKLENVIDIYLP